MYFWNLQTADYFSLTNAIVQKIQNHPDRPPMPNSLSSTDQQLQLKDWFHEKIKTKKINVE